MKDNKYIYFSRYVTEGLENHRFNEVIIPVRNDAISEIYLYKKEGTVFIDFEIRKDVKSEDAVDKECVSLIEKLYYRLIMREIYVPKICFVHETSSYPPIDGKLCASITLRKESDFYGEKKIIDEELLEGFDKECISNQTYKDFQALLGIKEKAYRFDALYQYLSGNNKMSDFIEWLKEEGLLDEYDLEMRENPDEQYRGSNKELDDLSYLRTLISHFQADKSNHDYKKEYEEMIDANLFKIISIIKKYEFKRCEKMEKEPKKGPRKNSKKRNKVTSRVRE